MCALGLRGEHTAFWKPIRMNVQIMKISDDAFYYAGRVRKFGPKVYDSLLKDGLSLLRSDWLTARR